MASKQKNRLRSPNIIKQHSLTSSSACSQSGSVQQKPKSGLFRKQLSVDSGTSKYSAIKKPPAPRLAWQENSGVEIVATKCSEHPKIAAHKPLITTDPALLYSRQQLAERLRKAWKERDTKSIDIFLARSMSINDVDADGLSRESSILDEQIVKANVRKSPEKKTLSKKISLVISPFFREAIDQSATGTGREGTKLSVEVAEKGIEASEKTTESNIPAATRRDHFRRSKIKTAPFSETIASETAENPPTKLGEAALTRPPLLKSQSVPCTPASEPPSTPVPRSATPTAKQKFPMKRRLKTAPSIRRRNTVDESGVGEKKTSKARSKKKPPLQRCRSAQAATDIVTMVSLTSPPLSDTEENAQKTAANLAKIRKQNLEKKAEMNAKLEAQRLITLKKIVKQVSFQPSATVYGTSTLSATVSPLNRNHSATSFLLRRGSVAAPVPAAVPLRTILLQSTAVKETSSAVRRASLTSGERTQNYLERPGHFENRGFLADNDEMEISCNSSETKPFNSMSPEDDARSPTKDKENVDAQNSECRLIAAENQASDSDEPQFATAKEKQCWKLYRKMCAKGVDVSFDTILKGILTPTEYRLRTKIEIPTIAENHAQINSNKSETQIDDK